MLSSHQQPVGTRDSSRDQLVVLLVFTIGIAGLIFVFFLPDPTLALASQIPMLSPQEWPGSHANQPLAVREAELVWQEERRFFQNLSLHDETHANNTISQEAVWYADPLKAADLWHRLVADYEATYGQQAVPVNFTSNANNNQPESKLFCRLEGMPDADDPHTCAYFAHSGHWFTQVMFFQEFQLSEIQSLIIQIDQHLTSARSEPCYWIFCTGQSENGNR